jgi:hypothetical protein
MPKLTWPKFSKEKKKRDTAPKASWIDAIPGAASKGLPLDVKPNAHTEGSQSRAFEEEDAASRDPLFSESKEKNGLFMLHSKPENEESLVEYASL